jgi:glycosyltransferase involved in cell wall biosynthesis
LRVAARSSASAHAICSAPPRTSRGLKYETTTSSVTVDHSENNNRAVHKRRMHVGLNLAFLVPGETGGMETYARELIAALIGEAPEVRFTPFLSEEAAQDTSAPWSAIPAVTLPVRARQRAQWVWGEQRLLPGLAQSRQIDVVHSFASTSPLWGQFGRVVTIHDLIYRIYPEAHSSLRRRGMAMLVPLSARRSHRIIAPSERTRDDLVRLLQVPREKVDVVPEGVRVPTGVPTETALEIRARLGLGTRPLVLTLSAKRPHKNLTRLLEGLALIPAGKRPVLLLPGYRTPWQSGLQRKAAILGIEADVRFLDWVSPDELESLFAATDCFVFPSLYEGFGLPVLEAMARGVPVACSNRAALPEVANGAARFFDPERPDEIAAAISTLLTDEAEASRLARAGSARAGTFSWSRAACATLAVYERALTAGRLATK